jgi:uncharacterized protein YqgC (DUF456 family)
MSFLVAAAVVFGMLGCIFLIPLGLPGLWLIVVTVLGLVLAGEVGWGLGLTVAGVAVAVEVAELLVLRRFGRAFGGSRRAFWGALFGGFAGLFFGAPIPVVGSIVTAFLGTFAGAGIVTWFETRSLERSARVGWGVLLARTVAVGLKVGAAVGVVGAVAVALLL